MATNFRKQLLDNPQLPIDFIAGPDSYKRLPDLIDQVEETGEKGFDVTLSEFETYSGVYPTRESGINAWIAVMRGCDNFCTFCVVPYTRGRERSRSPINVGEEVERLSGEGFRQITLLGQNVNSYNFEGKDFAYLL
nr:radical SAM protein [Fodinibius sp.]